MKKTLTTLLLLMSVFVSFASEHEIKMLSWGKDGAMVFEPGVVKIAVGDTVTFLPIQSGHHVQSKTIPEGATEFTSQLDEKFSITLTQEGIYIYNCPPHRAMNMSGLIQVGKPQNREAINASVLEIEKVAQTNKGRLQNYLKQLDAMNQ